jgi:arabinan endo-1,5-alpha-L-arabinosidase
LCLVREADLNIMLRRCLCSFGALLLAHAACADPALRNPLTLRLTDGAPADNCADPAIIRERAGEQSWYLFCTTDPIDRRERTPDGWKFHLMPVFRSADLQEWRYVGDAFSTLPALAAPKAGLWAPEPQYFNGRYHLYFAVTDVVDGASPEPGCGKDSAIAVATSASPAGPWETSATPVVPPRRAGPGCEFHWTIDPRAVQAEDGRKYLYYGSYGGGMFVQRLSDDGLRVAGEPVRVGASGRYEGAEVVRHGGKWYLFASATDCCNGPLTGYALFVGRADRPEGPFLDRHGQDMAAPRAGGTPVLVQNGNRWVGPGHNTVFQDGAGQWWTIYHAIDRQQPYFSARDKLTRRVALIERIDWVDGWPVIAGGAGPTDGALAAAAPATSGTATLLWADAFRRLGARWRWLRTPPEGWRAGPGGLRLPTQAADLHHDTDNAAVLNTALPRAGDYRIDLRVQLDAPLDCYATPVQAGVVVYRDDDNYVKLVELAHRGLRQVEFAKEVFPVDADHPRYGNTVVGAPAAWTWLRLEVRRGGGEELYTAWSSHDGRAWVRGGSWTHRLGGAARLGLVAMGGAGSTARIARVAVSSLR